VDFPLSLDFFDSGLYTRTAVARLTLALAKLSCINRQVVPKIYDTFSKEVRPDRVIAKVFKNLIRMASSRAHHYQISVISGPKFTRPFSWNAGGIDLETLAFRFWIS